MLGNVKDLDECGVTLRFLLILPNPRKFPGRIRDRNKACSFQEIPGSGFGGSDRLGG